MMDTSLPLSAVPHLTVASRHSIEWRSRYEGRVAVAYIDDKAIAGISGPWSGKFALTWWERPLPARQLELFATLEAAKREVETWALRMRVGYPTSLPGIDVPAPCETAVAPRAGLLEQVRTLLPELTGKRARGAARENVERMRQLQACRDTDISGLHFAAYE